MGCAQSRKEMCRAVSWRVGVFLSSLVNLMPKGGKERKEPLSIIFADRNMKYKNGYKLPSHAHSLFSFLFVVCGVLFLFLVMKGGNSSEEIQSAFDSMTNALFHLSWNRIQ